MTVSAPPTQEHRRDEGSTLILVLVMVIIASLIMVPLMNYAVTTMRAQNVQSDKAQAIQLARGGTWVALSNERALYDQCNGGSLVSSLAGVSTTCEVLETATLRHPEEVPYSVAVLQGNVGGGASASVPTALTAGLPATAVYANPNTAAAPATWLQAPDWTPSSQAAKVWIPQLPVQATSSGGTRDTAMRPGTFDPRYASCRVFFPGTFTTPIELTGPTYFTSGVYYFTEPITVRRGADVVVGNGAGLGCTTDFDAVADAYDVPDPLNIGGKGGTFVFGSKARLLVDDSVGSGDVRFVMNQRYVSNDEVSVAVSSSVSIVSVNGTHEPLIAPDALGNDLLVDGVLAVPASTVDDPADDPDDPSDDPKATTRGYLPSVLTPKPTPPNAPTNVVATAFRVTGGPSATSGRVTVTWDEPNANGSLITQYVVQSATTTQTCTTSNTEPATPTPAPSNPRATVRRSCTIVGLNRGTSYRFTVTAFNAAGASPASVQSNATVANSSTNLSVPSAPVVSLVPTMYSNGLYVSWTPSATTGNTPINAYTLEALTPLGATVATCTAYWYETGCLLPGIAPGLYVVRAKASNLVGDSAWSILGSLPVYVPGPTPAPIATVAPAAVRVPDPIVDFELASNAKVTVLIEGYVAVPQGHVRFNAANPASKSVRLQGGVVAAQIRLDAAPATLSVVFDNPVAQKRIRLRSSARSGGYDAVSDAVIQVNRSGSIAINSWFSQ